MTYKDYLQHHGIKKMKWGKRNGPPYPLTDAQRSAAENAANATSASAKMLAERGDDNRFAKSDRKQFGSNNAARKISISDAAKDTNLKRSAKGNGQAIDGTTHADVVMDRKKKFADKYGYKEGVVNRGGDKENEKSEKATKAKKSAADKEAERAAKAAEAARKKAEREAEAARKKAEREAEKARKEAEKKTKQEEKEVDRATERALKAIDRIFDGSTSGRSMDALLDELSEGWLNGKHFKAEDFKELEKNPKYKEAMEKLGDSKGSSYYAKLLAQLGDKNDPKTKEMRAKYEKLMKERAEEDKKQGYEDYETLKKRMGADFKDESLDRFARSISVMTDYVDSIKDQNPSAMNRARSKVLSYLEDKITWLNENRSNSGDRTANLKEKRNYQKVTEWLRRKGF